MASVAITSCSHQKTVTSEELRSTLTQAVSFASESETFLDYVLQKRSTRNYAAAHLEYLLDEVSRSAKELHESSADSSTQQVLSQSQQQLDRLVESLRYASQQLENADKLQLAKQQIADTRRALEKTKDSL